MVELLERGREKAKLSYSEVLFGSELNVLGVTERERALKRRWGSERGCGLPESSGS